MLAQICDLVPPLQPTVPLALSGKRFTAKAETDTIEWLVERIKRDPDNPPGKEKVWLEAQIAGHEVSKTGFIERIWPTAVTQAKAPKWSKAGRKQGADPKSKGPIERAK